MSMEHGVSTSTVKTSHGANGASGHSFGKSQAGAAGGFASLLSGLGAEDETLGVDVLGLDASQTVAGEGFDLATDVDTTAAVPGFGFDPLHGGAGALAPQGDDPAQTAAAAAAALAALGLEPLAGTPGATDALAAGATDSLKAVAGAGAVIPGQLGANMPGEGFAKTANGLSAGRVALQAGVDTQGTARDATVLNSREATTALLGKTSEVTTLAMDGLGLQRQVGQRNATVRADAAKADQLRGAKGEDAAARLGWRSDMVAQATQAALAASGQQSGAMGDTAGRFGSSAGERAEEGARATVNDFAAMSGLSNGVSGSTGVDSSNTLTPAAVYTDPLMSPETQVAEQVSYWVGRGARNAEISVEGLSENPIHITIAMQGQETHVAFRAEQADTRQVLEDAVPHLRELLEREGLTLADVSVGHSDPGWSGGSEASAQAREQAAQRARVGGVGGREGEDTGGAALPGAARAVTLPAGRTLDLFV
ncbi:flagellar hook-length control protein FliK [Hylemonella gracilis]|uniref:Flagellar hook-length control protein n=1 Tax=Hylemonella gracilis ATCC 19624 TaxID=887062 RepID=F3KWL2_9BURK|nr:flagellar hook-length control protein FliK [Hylemonella gracilis]EGI75825.1 flagellar hook-length control protein [Hylemonella gracilis ATCC 19624]